MIKEVMKYLKDFGSDQALEKSIVLYGVVLWVDLDKWCLRRKYPFCWDLQMYVLFL